MHINRVVYQQWQLESYFSIGVTLHCVGLQSHFKIGVATPYHNTVCFIRSVGLSTMI
jgi:hypothetical protein